MRRIVLIDGENLTYGLRTLLSTEDEKLPRNSLNTYDFRGLTEEVLADQLPGEILWFGARLRQYAETPELLEKTNNAIRRQSYFVNHVQSQKITFIKAGYLRLRETDPCSQCQNKEWKFIEKGVDVGLAVRMLAEAHEDTEIIIVSADTDLVPAVRASKKLGAKIMFVGYEYRPISALSSIADSTRVITIPIARRFLQEGLDE
ncbi:MAG: NYN domain-containing protein [Candidatus Saccharimonadales bacterium]